MTFLFHISYINYSCVQMLRWQPANCTTEYIIVNHLVKMFDDKIYNE